MRNKLQTQLRMHRRSDSCPFLVNDICSIHSLRPLACKQFKVFSKACGAGEDPYYSRRDDALYLTLLSYGMTDEVEHRAVIDTGEIQKLVQVLQDCNWSSLVKKIADYDSECEALDTYKR